MEPITRSEIYMAAAAGEYSGELPEPVTRLEYYLKKIKEAVENGSSVAPEDIDAAIEASAGTGLSLSGTTFSNSAPNVKSDWNAAAGTDAEILNKPTIPNAEVIYSGEWDTTSGTVLTLQSSIDNYDAVDILFACVLSSNLHSSTRIAGAKKATLSITDIPSVSSINMYSVVLSMSNNGTTISTDRAYHTKIVNSETSCAFTVTDKLTDTVSTGKIRIYKIIGYNF